MGVDSVMLEVCKINHGEMGKKVDNDPWLKIFNIHFCLVMLMLI
jgi:hypothetical protein